MSEALSRASNNFTKDVYLNLAAVSPVNAVISPLSLHVVLGLASFGASGSTADAMLKALRIQHSETLLKDYKDIIDQLSKSPLLNIAHKIYLGKNVKLSPTYQTKAVEYFNSDLGQVDFAQSAAAANQMNRWVSDRTDEKIKHLVDASSLSADTKLVLINAIHFKGIWTTPFKTEDTEEGPFYLDKTNSVEVPLMHLEDNFYMHEEKGDGGFKMLELPYEVKEDLYVYMHIFLPNKRDGLAALERKLFQTDGSFAEKFDNIVRNTFSAEVRVTLPRFKIESTWNMTELCTKLGMDVAFSDKADFSLMTEDKTPLMISEVIQKAFVEVNEAGTVAAAATDIVEFGSSGPAASERIMTFQADHPFCYIISVDKHTTDKTILFLGKLEKF